MTGIKELKNKISVAIDLIVEKLNILYNTKEEESNKQQDLLSTDPDHYPSVPAINGALQAIIQGTSKVLSYNTYNEMVLDENNQEKDDLLYVEDATSDPLLTFDSSETKRWALYRYGDPGYNIIGAPYQLISGLDRMYVGATPSTKTIENIPAGTDLSIYTLDDLLENIYAPYMYPYFKTFNISQSDVEVGATISGIKVFTFSFENESNVETASIEIKDETQNVVLDSGIPVMPGSVQLSIGTITNNSPTEHVWKAEALDTKGGIINKTTKVNWNYMYFFGGSQTDIVTSAQVRSLPTQGFDNTGIKEFEVVLGTGHTSFYLFIPNTRKIEIITDRQAANTDVSSNYEFKGVVNVKDAGGVDVPYKKYRYDLSNNYSNPHTHDVKLKND